MFSSIRLGESWRSYSISFLNVILRSRYINFILNKILYKPLMLALLKIDKMSRLFIYLLGTVAMRRWLIRHRFVLEANSFWILTVLGYASSIYVHINWIVRWRCLPALKFCLCWHPAQYIITNSHIKIWKK